MKRLRTIERIVFGHLTVQKTLTITLTERWGDSHDNIYICIYIKSVGDNRNRIGHVNKVFVPAFVYVTFVHYKSPWVYTTILRCSQYVMTTYTHPSSMEFLYVNIFYSSCVSQELLYRSLLFTQNNTHRVRRENVT